MKSTRRFTPFYIKSYLFHMWFMSHRLWRSLSSYPSSLEMRSTAVPALLCMVSIPSLVMIRDIMTPYYQSTKCILNTIHLALFVQALLGVSTNVLTGWITINMDNTRDVVFEGIPGSMYAELVSLLKGLSTSLFRVISNYYISVYDVCLSLVSQSCYMQMDNFGHMQDNWHRNKLCDCVVQLFT
jgi:hypothetical protein